jgi:hypothetical protein
MYILFVFSLLSAVGRVAVARVAVGRGLGHELDRVAAGEEGLAAHVQGEAPGGEKLHGVEDGGPGADAEQAAVVRGALGLGGEVAVGVGQQLGGVRGQQVGRDAVGKVEEDGEDDQLAADEEHGDADLQVRVAQLGGGLQGRRVDALEDHVDNLLHKLQTDEHLEGKKLGKRAVGGQLALQLAVNLQDGDNGNTHAGLGGDLEPQGGKVDLVATVAVDAGGLGDVGENGNQNGDDWVLEDEDPRLAVLAHSGDGGVSRLGLHQSHGREEDIAVGLSLGGEETAEQEKEGGQGKGLGDLKPWVEVGEGGRSADQDESADSIDGDKGADSQYSEHGKLAGWILVCF